MFRRRWSSLPADPVFAADLKELGYFINEDDEIRSIENPKYYFKYFLTKNDRWNERQRFAFNEAVTKIIHSRLDAEGFVTILLPLGTPRGEPHVPIRASADLAARRRVVLLFGESCQSLGVLAHRVIGGRGGIERGSVLSLVRGLKDQAGEESSASSPGLVLANAGELWWWPEGGRGLTPAERHMVPMASAALLGRYHDPVANEVPGHRTVAEHVRAVFETVVLGGGMLADDARVDVIALGDTADVVEEYLNDDEVWASVGRRLNCMVVLGGFYDSARFRCEGFKRFMEERGRAYIIHHTPLDTPIAGPGGNPGATGFTSFGCPVYSAGGAKITETMLIEAMPAVLKWLGEVAAQGDAYKNEVFERFGEEGGAVTTEEPDSPWGAAEEGADGGEKPADKEAKGKEAMLQSSDSGIRFSGDSAATEGNHIAAKVKAQPEAGGGKAGVKHVQSEEREGERSGGGGPSEVKNLEDLGKGVEHLGLN